MTQEFEQNSDRTGLEVQTICRALADNLFYIQGKYHEIATKYDFAAFSKP
jgi:hypothetical protein